MLTTGGITTLEEPQAFRASRLERSNTTGAAWLREHYDRGRVLMQSWNNETIRNHFFRYMNLHILYF